MVLRRWGSETQTFGFINLLIRSDEGLTLETPAFNPFTVANLPYQHSFPFSCGRRQGGATTLRT